MASKKIKLNNKKKINNTKLLITYDSVNLSYNNKIRFYYALKGRDGKSGIVKLYKINFLGKKVFMIDNSFINEIKSFLNQWNLKYTITEILILSNEKNMVGK